MADNNLTTFITANADFSSLRTQLAAVTAQLVKLQETTAGTNAKLANQIAVMNKSFADTMRSTGQFSTHFVSLSSDVEKFGKNLDRGRLKLSEYYNAWNSHTRKSGSLIKDLAKQQVMLENAIVQPVGKNAQGLMQYNVMVAKGLDEVKHKMALARQEAAIMNKVMLDGSNQLINWGKNTQWAGRQLTVGLTVPLVAFGAAAQKAFREADQELVRLTKVYGGLAATSASDLKEIREEVIQTAKTLSKTMGASFKDTIALGADIAATGKTGNDLLGSISETTRLAVLGEVDRQDAMKATLSIQTAFKQNTQQLTESINFLNAVENQTSTTLNDLVEAIPKAGPVIQQLGGDVKDLALYLTAMREGGVSASEGANALKSGLASMINPTKQTIGVMGDFGIDIMGMVAKNTGNTTGMLMDLQKALDSLDPLSKARAMEQMFGKFQFARMSALLNNLGKQGSQTMQVLDLMKASTTELADVASRELKMVTESASGKYKRAIEGLKAELADVGEEFLGVATKIITAATKILDFFTGLPAPIKKALTFLAGFTALVGPLIMLTGVLANFFGYITKGVVQLRAFFMKANGWKMLTPEIIAAQKAAEMVENAFYSDAAAAQVLHSALQKLVLDYQNLQAASSKNAIPVNPGISTVSGNTVMAAGRRVVDPNDPYVGDINTRAMSHINPRDPNSPATIFGGVPGAVPVNRGISRTPQMYMPDRLPNIEGLTSVKNISTGIVPAEAAKFHALMATLGMQTEQEVAMLKKTIAMGGTVSADLLNTFDDILPITQKFANSAAEQSALIVQQLRNADITVEQAKARIIALNAQIEADMGAAVTAYAASKGRTLDLTKAPMMNQPVVDANGQFTLRDLYKKKANAAVMEEFGRVRGVRTFGAPYSIQTTRMPKFNTGGDIESFGPGKTQVSGPSSINYDDRLGSVPVGGYVLNQAASMDPANAPLVAMASATYENGGEITAALTPKETVFGPKIQRMPELYAAVDAANSGYNFGGQIMNGITGYGRKTDKTPQVEDKAYYKKQIKEYLRFINNPRYEDDIRLRMIMLDAAEMVGKAGIPMDKAINIAASNFDLAKQKSGGSLSKFIDLRIKQVQGLEKRYPKLKLANSADTRTGGGSKALNYELNNVRSAMLSNPKFKNVFDLIEGITPTDIKNSKGMPLLQGLHARGHIKRHSTVGYGTSGHMGVAAVIPHGINSIMARLQDIGISPDVLNLTGDDARKNFEVALKSVGMHKMTTIDDIATALEDNNLFKSKAQIQSGSVVRATQKQRNDLQMFLEAVMSRKKWVLIPRGRPPIMTPVLAKLNMGGMIPGGSVSRNRSSYGNVSPLLKLLAPDKQLKILQQAREMSKATATGIYKDVAPVNYGHMVAPSSGMSYPIPGVSGLYKDADGTLKFFKGVPNEISAKAEIYGTRMAREVFGLESPEQTVRTIANPLDPTGKSKLLGLESPFDKKFAVGGTKFSEDEMIRQTIASLVMNNKDLSPSNVYGNVLADVGAAGVFPKASGNTEFAKNLPSMGDQGVINLLGVKGGARKDFAVNTAPIAARMTATQYSRKMKKAMEKMYPKLVKFVATLPKEDRGPYIQLLKRFEDGMENTDFKKLHGVHVQAKRNSGGPVGGSIQRGRYAYGRPGNPARAAWEAEQRAQKERDAAAARSRAASHQIYGQQALTSGLGREAVRTGTTTFYNPGAAIQQQMLQPLRNAQLMYTGHLNALSKSLATSMLNGSAILRASIKTSGSYVGGAYKDFGTSIVNSGKAAMQKIQASSRNLKNQIIVEQNAFAARNYPTGQAPQQGLFGPGYIGRYKDLGDGLQSRKVGTLGFRKTEYLVNGTSMTAKQAKGAGIAIPQRANGMSMGAQMGIGMAGSMGGMALMQKEKVNVLGKEMSGMSAGMGVMIASSVLPMLPIAKMARAAKDGIGGVTKAISALRTGAMTASKVLAGLLRFAKAFGPIGLAISAVFEGFMIYKRVQDDWQDARMGLSMTAKAAEQAGIKYFNLQETMQGYIDKQKLAAAAAKGAASSSIGMPGLPQSIEEMKKAKEEGKGLKDLIESLNRSTSTAETQRLVNNQKAQMVAAGMSIEEANKKIYGALANSNKASQSYKMLADQQFGAIVDKSSAAEFAVGNLLNTLNNGAGTADWYKEVGNGFEGLINVFSNATSSLEGTKDALGNVIDEYEAYQIVMSKTEANNPKMNESIGSDVYSNLAKTQPLLASITNETDTIKGILAKWKLFTAGINIDLSKIDSTLANKLAGFTSAIGTGIDQLTKAADNATTYGTVGSALAKLQKTISATSAASQRAAAASQRSAQEELKVIAKKIKLIEDEKNKKLESLRATQDASNYALELQKLQIEYADAVSRGDTQAAARARLDIDQLTMNRQSELAAKAIEDAANKAKAPLEKDAERIQDKSDKKTIALQNAQDNSSIAGEIMTKVTGFQTRYNDLTTRGIEAKLLPAKERAAEEAKIQAELLALIKEIQTSGKGTGTTAKTIRDAFAAYFNKDGSAINPSSTTTGSPTGFDKNGKPILSTITTPNQSVLDTFNKDMAAVTKLASSITGGVTLKQLRDDVLVALGKAPGKAPKGTTEFGPSVVQTGTGKNAFEGFKSAYAKGQGTMVDVNGQVWYKFNWNGKTYVSDNSGVDIRPWDEKTKTMGKRIKKANGGVVKYFGPGGGVYGPGTGTSDSIPAMLSNGEYVIRAESVQAIGVPMLDKINKLASGGMVSYDIPKYSSGGRVRFNEGGLASSTGALYNINVELNGTNLTADEVAASIHKEMRIREMTAGVNRRIGG